MIASDIDMPTYKWGEKLGDGLDDLIVIILVEREGYGTTAACIEELRGQKFLLPFPY